MYDLVIIGAGPAGLSAAIYASCFKLNYVALGSITGGQMSLAPDILNYPGFAEIAGTELTDHMLGQLEKRGGAILTDTVTQITKHDTSFVVHTESNKEYETKTIIFATGVERRKLNIPGESEYAGKGVQYCAKCERFSYQDKICAVIGGANAAAQTAIQLSHAAKKVFIVYRGDELRCDPIWSSQITTSPVIEVLYQKQPLEIVGDGEKVTAVKLQQTTQEDHQTTEELPIDQLYVEIGGIPGTRLLSPLGVAMDAGGFVDVDDHLTTSIPGIFAAGDVISHKYSIEQISSAVGLGARACVSVLSYLKQQK